MTVNTAVVQAERVTDGMHVGLENGVSSFLSPTQDALLDAPLSRGSARMSHTALADSLALDPVGLQQAAGLLIKACCNVQCVKQKIGVETTFQRAC